MKALIALMISAVAAVAADPRPLLLVLTNHKELGDTGKPTGFFLSEAAHPFQVFEAADREVVLASPQGDFAPIDPKSMKLEDAASREFWEKFGNGDPDRPGVAQTKSLRGLKAEDFDGIFFAGGHGAMWDFPDSDAVQSLTAAIDEQGGVVGAVCHGPASLVKVKRSNGESLVSGKKVAVFTNAEEKAVELTQVVPFSLEDALREAGAEPQIGENFQENAVLDGRLATGQNPASATRTAELFLEALRVR
ncbi:putative intracellular protease/amidase [Haloferula luteola]|uniref:Putative intracellular protease/amidase n=1 Tax=Haloferula luteola TaxID=595692 RepID=A0A840VFB0_9BACT|nr:type 1 glutamine amidotransferase domain-containing protein [Haloferula luteola]MBB5352500.1 putative intracellular protease/amidase [Haloferula luteola]